MLGRREEEVEREEVERQLREVELQERMTAEAEEQDRVARTTELGEPEEGRDLDEDVPDADDEVMKKKHTRAKRVMALREKMEKKMAWRWISTTTSPKRMSWRQKTRTSLCPLRVPTEAGSMIQDENRIRMMKTSSPLCCHLLRFGPEDTRDTLTSLA